MELKYNGKTNKDIIALAKKDSKKFNNINLYKDNILIYGDNFIGLSVLLEKYKGKIDLIYIDPPFNTDQIFYVTDNRNNAISKSKNGIIAYSDKMDLDTYLEFLRERLILMRELLSEKGSIYLHIDYKVGHYVKIIMDEVFGFNNFKNDITRIKSNPKNFYRKAYGNEKDLILFYAKNYSENIWNDIKIPLDSSEIEERFSKVDIDGRRYTTIPLHAPGSTKNGNTSKPWRGIPVPEGRHWRTDPSEFDRLDSIGMIEWSSTGNPRIKKYADEHQGKKIQDIWRFKDPQKPIYPTQKNSKMIEQIILQSSKEDSIVLDCFAGGGTTLKSAEKLGRKWIGMDSSSVSIGTIKKQFDADSYDYIEL
ncbi:MAG: site-specific DNA-methyltransferase [Firmicutes bacterium]|nr:site-specific DNA-methyltransferase [Bacillota bacterium]